MRLFHIKTVFISLVFVISMFFIVLCGKDNGSKTSQDTSQSSISSTSTNTATATATTTDTTKKSISSSNSSSDTKTSTDSNNNMNTNTTNNTMTETNTNPSNHTPTVSVLSPNGSNFIIAGTQFAITYSASDADNDPLTFKIEYSANNGTNWIQIANGITDHSLNWDTTGLSQGILYRIKVTVSDGNGGSASDSSNSAFGVADSDISYTNTVSTLMSNNCSPCHNSGGSASSLFVRTPYSGSLNPGNSTIRTKIQNQAINTQSMPPAGMSASNRQLLQLWLWNSGKE